MPVPLSSLGSPPPGMPRIDSWHKFGSLRPCRSSGWRPSPRRALDHPASRWPTIPSPMNRHSLESVEGPAPWIARCSCAWSATSAVSGDRAEARWRVHSSQARSAEVAERAADFARRSEQRLARLAEVRAERRATRDRLALQLAEARRISWRVRRLSVDNVLGPPPRPGARIELARRLAGCTLIELWWDYVALGGNATPREVEEMLRERRPITRIEHDVLVCALNERFAADGLGHPLDDWDTSARSSSRR